MRRHQHTAHYELILVLLLVLLLLLLLLLQAVQVVHVCALLDGAI
jgi:uncharacterized integral membrane protein